jgi:uncharacterized protein YndB with AHSA1/START domain
MKDEQPLIMERTYTAPVAAVWSALTNIEQMRRWYFDMDGFRPEVGAEFTFAGEKDGIKKVHLCQVKEVIQNKKISYSWRYKDHEGMSLLTFELFDEGENTRLKLTHAGLETFKVFTKQNFQDGWNHFINTALVNFLSENKINMEKKPYQCRITVPVSQSKTADAIADVRAWWSEDFEGASRRAGDVFTVRFGETFMTFRVVEASESKIAWLVIDCYKHWLKGNKKEWNGTTVVFELSAAGDKTQIDFTHLGLVPGIECYEGCEDGWNFYIKDSLFKLLTEGKGKPNTPKAER